ncbi:MAG: hypothetical protein LH624_12365 [Cryobacterium sp.]|nr:hypothetical protein [Cryobacterium sp.]
MPFPANIRAHDQTSRWPTTMLSPAIGWGAVVGVITAATPLGLWWLTPSLVYALVLAIIAAVYIGFAVTDGRARVLVLESTVAVLFVALAVAALTGSAWLVVAGFAGHGLKDLWQHRTRFVRHTRWWPPFCATVDFVAAGILAVHTIFTI